MTAISRGTVVTVFTPDTVFTGKQGILEVDATNPTQDVGVRFGRELSYLFGFSFKPEGEVVEFPAGQLRPDADFTIEIRVERLFGRNCWNQVYSFKKPFDPAAGHECNREGCTARATKRILVNIWGTVCEHEVCGPCAEQWHGKLVDDFPAKNKRAA
jgi:hypothetical protein